MDFMYPAIGGNSMKNEDSGAKVLEKSLVPCESLCLVPVESLRVRRLRKRGRKVHLRSFMAHIPILPVVSQISMNKTLAE